MSKETRISKVENGFILEEFDSDDFSKPPRKRVAKDKDDVAKMMGLNGEQLLPSEPIGGDK